MGPRRRRRGSWVAEQLVARNFSNIISHLGFRHHQAVIHHSASTMTPHFLASGSEAMASLASQIVQYTGGDTRFGRRVRIGAAATLLAIALHTVVIIGVSGSSSCCKKRKRSAIQENLRNVGKAVAGEAAVESKGDRHEDFDEYDVVIVGGGMCAHHTGYDFGRFGTRSPGSGRRTWT